VTIAQLASYSKHFMGGTRGRVLALALPSVGEQILNMMVGMANTYMVGHLGSASLTAVGLSDQIVMLFSAFFLAVSTGNTALVARCIGARDKERACNVLQQSMLTGGAIGLACTVVGMALSSQAMIWFGAAKDVIPLGSAYLWIVSLSYALMALMFIGNSALRGAGDTRTPLWVMGIVNVVNIAVGYALLTGLGPLPALGVRGTAIGATVARSLGCAIVLGLLVRGRAGLKLRLRISRPDWGVIKRVMNIGLPSGAEQICMRFGQVTFAAIVASLGTVAYAAHQISFTSLSMSFMPGFGFGMAATTLVGQQLGAKNPEGAEEACKISSRMAMYLMGAVGILMFLFAPQIVGFFITEPEVIRLGAICVRIVGLTQPATAGMMVFSGGLRGAGDTRWPLIITAISVWLVRIPLGRLFALTFGLGLPGVWVAVVVDMMGRALLFYWRFHSGKWKTIRV